MINKLKEGQSYKEWIPTHKILKICELSGDYNPIHTDPEDAKIEKITFILMVI